jgi:exopolysaccharide biosynthesis polyprenyl glycosylphosphotransferase
MKGGFEQVVVDAVGEADGAQLFWGKKLTGGSRIMSGGFGDFVATHTSVGPGVGPPDVIPHQSRRGEDRQTADATSTRATEARSPLVRPFAAWCRTWGFHVEVLLSFIVGLLVVVATGEHEPAVAAVLGVWAFGNFHKGRALTSPLPQQMRMAGRSVLLPLAAAAGAVGFFAVPAEIVPPATIAVVSGATVSALCRALRWELQSPVRVLLVGDRVAIAQAVARWQHQDRVIPVAAVLREPDLDEIPSEIMGVPTVTGIPATPAIIEQFKADLVVVSPGPGFTSLDFRRLAWSLEETNASLGVLGVLDSVAPHRITPGSMQGATVCDVRLPRPSLLVERVKAVFDRVGAALLLVLVSPLLLAMSVAVRIDSRGKAFFTQTRVGRHGRLFTVYKMRTMVENAEQIKARLSDDNEYDGVLFKMRSDPRITRIGGLLRKSSLDELPQLINVVRGEMSLVGPRPSLPCEVDVMDADTLRRLAVRPGITGLWQVNGRSDLSWSQASALDTYYADNWSLTGDLSILLRTVKAVISTKGAY